MEQASAESGAARKAQIEGHPIQAGAEEDFRTSMRRHASGVCIVTAGLGEDVNGMAVTAASSFTMEPPSILVCINRSASISESLGEGDRFGLTVLGNHHQDVAAAFSRKPSGRPRFDHGRWILRPGGTPWLEDAPANLSCVVDQQLTYGTHLALVGRVLHVRLGPDTPSLVYRDGRYT